jgi:hypothetical protein
MEASCRTQRKVKPQEKARAKSKHLEKSVKKVFKENQEDGHKNVNK